MAVVSNVAQGSSVTVVDRDLAFGIYRISEDTEPVCNAVDSNERREVEELQLPGEGAVIDSPEARLAALLEEVWSHEQLLVIGIPVLAG